MMLQAFAIAVTLLLHFIFVRFNTIIKQNGLKKVYITGTYRVTTD